MGKAQAPDDFWQSTFFEFGMLPFFVRACQEAGLTEANPPAPLPPTPAGAKEKKD